MNEREWLAGLKPGDEVIVVSGYGKTYSLARVNRVTPSGRIIVGRTEFNPNGSQRGSDRWNTALLVEPTPERREQAERRALLGTLKACNFDALDTATLRAIAALLAEVTK